jgi:hypothetical protein
MTAVRHLILDTYLVTMAICAKSRFLSSLNVSQWCSSFSMTSGNAHALQVLINIHRYHVTELWDLRKALLLLSGKVRKRVVNMSYCTCTASSKREQLIGWLQVECYVHKNGVPGLPGTPPYGHCSRQPSAALCWHTSQIYILHTFHPKHILCESEIFNSIARQFAQKGIGRTLKAGLQKSF